MDHKMKTPSAKAMQTLISQVKTDMDNFSEAGKDIHYFLTMMSNSFGGNGADSMWCYYLLGQMMEFADPPECLPHFNINLFITTDKFPDEWNEDSAKFQGHPDWNGETSLPDDPNDLDYEDGRVVVFKDGRDPVRTKYLKGKQKLLCTNMWPRL
jgi:hypothetical protein